MSSTFRAIDENGRDVQKEQERGKKDNLAQFNSTDDDYLTELSQSELFMVGRKRDRVLQAPHAG